MPMIFPQGYLDVPTCPFPDTDCMCSRRGWFYVLTLGRKWAPEDRPTDYIFLQGVLLIGLGEGLNGAWPVFNGYYDMPIQCIIIFFGGVIARKNDWLEHINKLSDSPKFAKIQFTCIGLWIFLAAIIWLDQAAYFLGIII